MAVRKVVTAAKRLFAASEGNHAVTKIVFGSYDR
jgi:hypothetical protein